MSAFKTRLPFTPLNTPVAFDYTNYRGERATRRALLRDIYFGSTEYHPEDQWLVAGHDLDKNEDRIYAIKDMRPVAAVMKSVLRTADKPAKDETDPAAYLARGEYFTIRIQKDPLSARPDLPKQFTWMPTLDQRARAKQNHGGQTLEDLNARGGVTWAELAAILRLVPYSWIAEQRAVAACLVLYPQEGFVL